MISADKKSFDLLFSYDNYELLPPSNVKSIDVDCSMQPVSALMIEEGVHASLGGIQRESASDQSGRVPVGICCPGIIWCPIVQAMK